MKFVTCIIDIKHVEVLMKLAKKYFNSILKAFPSLQLVIFFAQRFYMNGSLFQS